MLDYISHKSSLPNHWKQNELSEFKPSNKEDNSLINVCLMFCPRLYFTTNLSCIFVNILNEKSVQILL